MIFLGHDHLLNFGAAPPQHPPFLSQSRITSVLAQFNDAASWLDDGAAGVSQKGKPRTKAGELLGQFLEHVAVTVVATARAVSLARETASCGAQPPPPQGLFESGLPHTFPSIRALDHSSVVSISVHDLLCAVAAECGSAVLGPYPRFQRSNRQLCTDKLNTVSPLTSLFDLLASKTFFATGTPLLDSQQVLAMQLRRLLGPLAPLPVPDNDASDRTASSPSLLVITRVVDFLDPVDVCSLAKTNFEMWRLCRGSKCGANGAWGTASQVRRRHLQAALHDGYALGNGWFWCLGQIARLEVAQTKRKSTENTLLDRQQHRAKLLGTLKARAQQVCEDMASSPLNLRYGFRVVRLASLAQDLVAHVKASSSAAMLQVRPFFLLHEGQLVEQGSVPGPVAAVLEHSTLSSAANWHRRIISTPSSRAPSCTTTFVFVKGGQPTSDGLELSGGISHDALLTLFRQSFGGDLERWRAWCHSRGVLTADDTTGGSAGVKNTLPVLADRKLWGLDSSTLVHRSFYNPEQQLQSAHATTSPFLETVTATLANGDVLGVLFTPDEDSLQAEELNFEMQQQQRAITAAKLAAEKEKQAADPKEQQKLHSEQEKQVTDQQKKQTGAAGEQQRFHVEREILPHRLKEQQAPKSIAQKASGTKDDNSRLSHHASPDISGPAASAFEVAPASAVDAQAARSTAESGNTQSVSASGSSEHRGFDTTSATKAHSDTGSTLPEPRVKSTPIFSSSAPFLSTTNDSFPSFSARTQEQSTNDIFRVPNADESSQ